MLLVAYAAAWGQSRVTGTITDSSGAVVPGARVVMRNVQTGQTTPAEANQSGVYSIPFLNPGEYELSCEQGGFKKFVRAGIVLETGATSTVDVRLDVGQLTETVSVTAAAPLLESESGAVGQLVESAMILNMPIQSRRVGAMVRLMGNVSFTGETGGQSIPRFSVAGGRSYNQMWHLDGGVVQNQAGGSPQLSVNPPNESLQEFKVMANNYPAEYGRSGSGVVVMATRSGTNDFHGAAYEWLRNDKLNARLLCSFQAAPALQHLWRLVFRPSSQEQDVPVRQLRGWTPAHRCDGRAHRAASGGNRRGLLSPDGYPCARSCHSCWQHCRATVRQQRNSGQPHRPDGKGVCRAVPGAEPSQRQSGPRALE
jgi:hypothetical protein